MIPKLHVLLIKSFFLIITQILKNQKKISYVLEHIAGQDAATSMGRLRKDTDDCLDTVLKDIETLEKNL